MTIGTAGSAAPHMDTDFPTETSKAGGVRFTARWGRSGAVINVRGEVDATNAGQFVTYLHHCAVSSEWLVLDLTELDFMGTAGFSALQAINTQCAKADVHWTLVPGVTVSRLLRVCDPQRGLPTAESVTSALETVPDPRRLLHLISQPG